MKTKNPAFLTALLSLKAIGVYGITCNTNQPLGSDLPALGLADTIYSALDGPAKALFEKGFSSNDITYTDGPTTFIISRSNEDIKAVEDCKTPFDQIIAQCIVKEGVWGGMIEADGLIFEIDKASDLEARKIKGKSSGSKKKKKTKTKSKKKKTKTKTKSHATKTKSSKGKATAKPTSKKIHSTKVSVTSTSTAKACALPTGKKGGKKGPKSKRTNSCGDEFTCKELIKAVEKEFSSLVAVDEDLSGLTLESRSDYVGGMSAMSSRHIVELEKRTGKSAHACGVAFKADEYPEKNWASGTFNMATQGYYGWEQPDLCENMKWGNPLAPATAARLQTTAGGGYKYQVEHVMEWQLVTHFFDWLDAKKGTIFDNPDPKKPQKVKFCEYFKGTFLFDETTALKKAKKVQTFALPGQTELKTPRGHLAAAYPSKQKTPEQFVWLEAKMNSPAKTQIYSDKDGENALDNGAMDKQMKTDQGAGEVMIKLKTLLGVRKYMKDPDIKKFFKDQKERIGTALDALDKELANHPREVGGVGTGNKNKAWSPQGLKIDWDTYMDERFALGVKRVKNDMDKYVPLLEKKYAAPKYGGREKHPVLGDAVTSLISEWRKEGGSKWDAPWA